MAYIKMDSMPYRKGEILNIGSQQVIITRVHRSTWWKRFIKYLASKVRINEYKIEQYGV